MLQTARRVCITLHSTCSDDILYLNSYLHLVTDRFCSPIISLVRHYSAFTHRFMWITRGGVLYCTVSDWTIWPTVLNKFMPRSENFELQSKDISSNLYSGSTFNLEVPKKCCLTVLTNEIGRVKQKSNWHACTSSRSDEGLGRSRERTICCGTLIPISCLQAFLVARLRTFWFSPVWGAWKSAH